MNRDERVWTKFHELLSLDLHDGDTKDAKERPCKNLHGSIESYKKVFKQAIAIIDAEDNKCETLN